jgi:predicted ATPase
VVRDEGAECRLELLITAIEIAQSTGEAWVEAELHRLKGEWLSDPRGHEEQAEACFRCAISVARRQSAKVWELRAATSLARVWRDQGKRAEAGELLAPIYGWFTEGFNMPVLQDAKTLIDQLA